MHSRVSVRTSATTTASQCRSIMTPASICSFSASPSALSSLAMPRPLVVTASRQLLSMPACGDSLAILRWRMVDSAVDSTNVACRTPFLSTGACAGGKGRTGGGASGREGGRKSSSSSGRRATVHESSSSNSSVSILENGAVPEVAAGVETGLSIPTDVSPEDRQRLRHLDLHPSDYVGFGRVLEDGSFRERFVIRFSEAGPRGTITIETLSSLLQEAATNHVIAMDYAFTPGKNLEGNIAVITRMHIEVDQYPTWRDLLEIDTWFQREGKNAVRRDWIVKDVRTGLSIAFATSTWVLMNTLTRRLTKLTEEQWTELEPHMTHPARWALSKERRDASLIKILKLGEEAAYRKSGLVACEKDTDMNQHVNNIRYMSWMLESVPEDVKSAFEVNKITLEYRQEAGRGQAVESMTEPEEPETGRNGSSASSVSTRQFAHLIRTSEAAKEINRGRTVWRSLH